MEDLHIIELYFSRDEQAIRHTADKYGPYCTAVSMSILHSEPDVRQRHLAEDVEFHPPDPSAFSEALSRPHHPQPLHQPPPRPPFRQAQQGSGGVPVRAGALLPLPR